MKKIKPFKAILVFSFYFTNILLARLVNRPIILCFHRIKKPSGSFLDRRVGVTDPDLFLRVLNYLKLLGYRFVTLDYLIKSIYDSHLEKTAVLTFDDGFKDLYQNAFPIIRRLNVPFTLFLTTSIVESRRLLWLHKLYVAIDRLPPEDRLGTLTKCFNLSDGEDDLNKIAHRIIQSNEITFSDKMDAISKLGGMSNLTGEEECLIAEKLYLTEAELIAMKEQGLNIEVHGHKHLPLACLSRLETEQELRISASYIKKELDGSSRFYALPYGIGNEFVRDVANNLEFQGIMSIESRLVNGKENPFSLPRFMFIDDINNFYKRLTKCYSKALLEKFRLLGTT